MAKVSINVSAAERDALRDGPAALVALVAQLESATPAQIQTYIDGLTLADAKKVIYVLAMMVRNHEKRLRALERR